MADLLPCPFCGRTAKMGSDPGSLGYSPPTYWVGCFHCNFKLPTHDATYYVWDGPERGTHDRSEAAKADATAAWNMRPHG